MVVIAKSWFNSQPRRIYIVVSLDKALYDDYLCLVWHRTSSKLTVKMSKKYLENTEMDNSCSRCGFVQNSATVAFS